MLQNIRCTVETNFRDFCEAAYAKERFLRDSFPSYITRALAYFKSPSANLRSSSVALVTRLVLTCDDDVLVDLLGNDGEMAEAVCRGMAGLVASDKSAVVQGRNSIPFKIVRKWPQKWPQNGILKKNMCAN